MECDLSEVAGSHFVSRLAQLASRSGSAVVFLKADDVPVVFPGVSVSVPGSRG